MIVVDEFYEEMKDYFEVCGNRNNSILVRYLNLIKRLKETGIKEGKTAYELKLFIDCAEKLRNATTELSEHINDVLTDYQMLINEIDKEIP